MIALAILFFALAAYCVVKARKPKPQRIVPLPEAEIVILDELRARRAGK